MTALGVATVDQTHRDMPPPGGFEAVKYKRNLPFRGPSGLVILGAITGLCTYGFYRVGKGNLEQRSVLFFVGQRRDDVGHNWMGLSGSLNVASWGCAHRETWGQGKRIRTAAHLRAVVPERAMTTDLGLDVAVEGCCFYSIRYRELQREKVWSRIHLVPLLLAEGDRDAYRRQQAALERERAIMKDVKGWEVSR